MNILIIARGYPSKKFYLNGIFEFDQAKALAKSGHKVVYAAIDMRSMRRWRKWGFESFVKDGVLIESINVPCGRLPNNILQKVKEISLNKLYEKIVDKHGEPDIIHAHFLGMGYATVKVLRDKKIPIFLTEHLSSMNQKIIPIDIRKLGEFTYPKVDKLITVSNLLAESIRRNFGVEAITIPNIVDASSFNFVNNIKKDKSFIFISTGALIKRKGMDVLINAFGEAFNNISDVKLYVFGEGPERENLEALINKLNLTKQVFLMGLVGRKVIADKMQVSDCFVLASQLETFGVVYIEAMAAGLPVIATRCGGPEEFITKDNGVLTTVNSREELSLALKYMFENANKYSREKISVEAKKLFSPESIADKLLKIYLDVLESKQHRR